MVGNSGRRNQKGKLDGADIFKRNVCVLHYSIIDFREYVVWNKFVFEYSSYSIISDVRIFEREIFYYFYNF